MKALDTNIIARFLRDDDPFQSKRAARIMQRAVAQREPLFIGHVVLCELSWILTSVYDHSKDELITVLENILSAQYLELEDRDSVKAAFEDFKANKVGFADCLIGRRNRTFGCDSTVTFDRSLRRLETFEIR